MLILVGERKSSGMTDLSKCVGAGRWN